jgi:flavoprotein
VKDPSSRLLGWRLKLEEYDNIVYKRASSNTNADVLSRIRVAETTHTENEKLKIFQEMLMKTAGVHLGMNKTYDRMKLFTILPAIKQKIENYFRNVISVRKTKLHNINLKFPYKLPLYTKLFEENAVWT